MLKMMATIARSKRRSKTNMVRKFRTMIIQDSDDDVVESRRKKRRVQALRISRSSLSACAYYDWQVCYTDVNKMISMFECEDHNCCKVFDKVHSHDISNSLNVFVHVEMKHPHDDDEDWWMQLYEHKEFLEDMHG